MTRVTFGFHIVNFPFCQAIFHQHQPTVSIHLSSFVMPVVAQIIMTIMAQGPCDKTCHRVTKLIVCPTHLRNSMTDTLIQLDNKRKMSSKSLLILSVEMIFIF